jgi:ankyrin repeat protein
MSLFNSLPLDLQRLICFLFLSVKDIKKIGPKFIENPEDVYWKDMVSTVTDEKTPNDTTHRDFYESFIYEKFLEKSSWNKELLIKMIEDEVFLSRHINATDKNDFTALMEVAYISPEESLGRKLFPISFKYSKEEICKILIAAGADINCQNKNGCTALMRATRNSSGENIKMLLAAGANVDQQDAQGYTALMIATYFEKEENIKILLAAGADVKLQNMLGSTAFSLAKTEKIRTLLHSQTL